MLEKITCDRHCSEPWKKAREQHRIKYINCALFTQKLSYIIYFPFFSESSCCAHIRDHPSDAHSVFSPLVKFALFSISRHAPFGGTRAADKHKHILCILPRLSLQPKSAAHFTHKTLFRVSKFAQNKNTQDSFHRPRTRIMLRKEKESRYGGEYLVNWMKIPSRG